MGEKITELTENTTPAGEDLVESVDDPSGSPISKKVTLQNISDLIAVTSPNNASSLHRQAIINGNFDVWQRGTSFTPTNAVYEVDRFITFFGVDGGTNPTLTASRQSITPGELDNSRYFYRLTTDGAGASYGTDAFYVFQQRVENGTRYLCGNGKKVTLSFYAKSDIAGKKIATYLEQNYGSGGSPTSTEVIKGEEFSLTTSWAKYTTTFTTNTLNGKTFGTDGFDKLQATIELMWGATRGTTYHNDSGGAEDFGGAGNIDIAQVQLCAGSVALPFQPKSFEEELRACQRYYEKSMAYATTPANGVGRHNQYGLYMFSTIQGRCEIALNTPKRIPITAGNVTFYRTVDGSADGQATYFAGSWTNASATALSTSTDRSFCVIVTTGTLTAYSTYLMSLGWEIDTEL